MGLDAYAYEHAELIEAGRFSDFDEDRVGDLPEGQVFLRPFDGAFEEQAEGLVDGIYRVSGEVLHSRRSYGGYSHLRDQVSRSVTGYPAEVVWKRDDWQDLTLGYWINFADNEGLIGPKTCALLADQAEAVGDLTLDSDWDERSWAEWRAMFRLAADTGLISYR
jgi:hypothetical protein